MSPQFQLPLSSGGESSYLTISQSSLLLPDIPPSNPDSVSWSLDVYWQEMLPHSTQEIILIRDKNKQTKQTKEVEFQGSGYGGTCLGHHPKEV